MTFSEFRIRFALWIGGADVRRVSRRSTSWLRNMERLAAHVRELIEFIELERGNQIPLEEFSRKFRQGRTYAEWNSAMRLIKKLRNDPKPRMNYDSRRFIFDLIAQEFPEAEGYFRKNNIHQFQNPLRVA